jgi:Uma2 family endonuclease
MAGETRPVWIPSCELNTYPDIFIAEESNMIKRKGYQLAETTPSVIIEVLSDSTEEFDRGEKWRCYKTIPSLKQYILISQDQPLVETFENEDGKWVYNDFKGEDAVVTITGLEIPLSKLYQNVDFQQ